MNRKPIQTVWTDSILSFYMGKVVETHKVGSRNIVINYIGRLVIRLTRIVYIFGVIFRFGCYRRLYSGSDLYSSCTRNCVKLVFGSVYYWLVICRSVIHYRCVTRCCVVCCGSVIHYWNTRCSVTYGCGSDFHTRVCVRPDICVYFITCIRPGIYMFSAVWAFAIIYIKAGIWEHFFACIKPGIGVFFFT